MLLLGALPSPMLQLLLMLMMVLKTMKMVTISILTTNKMMMMTMIEVVVVVGVAMPASMKAPAAGATLASRTTLPPNVSASAWAKVLPRSCPKSC